jgi:predicted nuclease with RNAse H fold
MWRRTSLVSLCLLTIAVPAFAHECPSGSRQPEEIIKAIRSAPACLVSFYVMKDCRSHDHRDAQLAQAVIEKCEATFLPHMSPGRKYFYQRAREVCARKFANRGGSIYESYQATCEAAVAARYAWWWGD